MIETERLNLRQWEDKDRERFFEIDTNPEVRKYFPKIPTKKESDEFIDRCMKDIEKNRYGFFAAEIRDTETLIGVIGISDVKFDASFTPATEIGWRLGKDYWGKGFATEGAKALLSFAFDFFKKKEIVAFTSKDNAPSIRVMERIGMTRDMNGNFMHPNVDPSSELAEHVLYRLAEKNFDRSYTD